MELSFGKVDWHTSQVCRNAWPLTLWNKLQPVADLRTGSQVHRFQIKRKINEFAFYHFNCTYRRCSWQHGNGNNWFAMQRRPKKNTKILGSWIYIPNILTRTLFQQFIHTPRKWFPSLELSTYASGFVKHEECWIQNKGPRQRTLVWKTDCEFLPGRLKLIWTGYWKINTAKYLTKDEHFLCL